MKENLLTELKKVREHIEQPKKDGTNPMFRSSYVTLDGVVKAVDDAIIKSKALISWYQKMEGTDLVTYVLAPDGENFKEYAIGSSPIASNLGNKGTNEAQAMGSALTYAKRYSLAMAFGITSEIDDDGNNATGSINRPNLASNTLKNSIVTIANKVAEMAQSDRVSVLEGAFNNFGASYNNGEIMQTLTTSQANSIIKYLKDQLIDLQNKAMDNEVAQKIESENN